MDMDFKHFYLNNTSYNIYILCSDHILSPTLQTQFVLALSMCNTNPRKPLPRIYKIFERFFLCLMELIVDAYEQWLERIKQMLCKCERIRQFWEVGQCVSLYSFVHRTVCYCVLNEVILYLSSHAPLFSGASKYWLSSSDNNSTR
jgi:hypothetical protein